jgi:hypothetical protein
MIIAEGNTDLTQTNFRRSTLAERRASQAKIHAEVKPFGGMREDGPTTPPTKQRIRRPTTTPDDMVPPRSPKMRDTDHFPHSVAGNTPTANAEETAPLPNKDLYQLFIDRRSNTTSPKDMNQLDSPNTTAVIKRLVSRCCMLQKIKNSFEECLRKSERDWESVIGTEHLPWASEHTMIEIHSEGHPRLTQFSDLITELVTVENELVNLLEEVIEYICVCIRRYSKRYNAQRHDNLTSKQFFRHVINSTSFKNSLNTKLAYNEGSNEPFFRECPHYQHNNHIEDDPQEFCPSSFEEEFLHSGKLQLELRSKLTESCHNIMDEIVSCKHPLMGMRNSDTLENIMTQMEHVVERHVRVLSQLKAFHNREEIDQGSSSTSPSADHLYEADDEDIDDLKVHERQQREEDEEDRFLAQVFSADVQYGLVKRKTPKYEILFF